MRGDLAQRLLAKVMDWSERELLREQAVVETLATYKYDEFENFEPGFKFVESLAQWLAQFDAPDREAAYRYIRRRLVFISRAEMNHLVRTAYPDVIRPLIRAEVARQTKLPEHQICRIESSPEFREVHRRSLFLGLSDGARIDQFRRSTEDIDNEQVYTQYEISDPKLSKMQEDLAGALQKLELGSDATFRLVFLLDDFSGTGRTMLRRARDGTYSGRLHKVAGLLSRGQEAGIIHPEARVFACLYVASEQAMDHIRKELRDYHTAAWSECVVHCQQLLRKGHCQIMPGDDAELDALLTRYYQDGLFDKKSYGVGGDSIKYGFGECGLSIVLHHNAPNNSLFVLWKEGTDAVPFRPLFPRFERHRELLENGGDEGR